jgi:protein-disulfide isomerase
MHDLLFSNQNVWAGKSDARAVFTGYAGNLNLDVAKFEADMDSSEIKNKVDNDYQSGLESGVDATPTFFLNGFKLAPPNSFNEFRDEIQRAIDSQ